MKYFNYSSKKADEPTYIRTIKYNNEGIPIEEIWHYTYVDDDKIVPYSYYSKPYCTGPDGNGFTMDNLVEANKWNSVSISYHSNGKMNYYENDTFTARFDENESGKLVYYSSKEEDSKHTSYSRMYRKDWIKYDTRYLDSPPIPVADEDMKKIISMCSATCVLPEYPDIPSQRIKEPVISMKDQSDIDTDANINVHVPPLVKPEPKEFNA